MRQVVPPDSKSDTFATVNCLACSLPAEIRNTYTSLGQVGTVTNGSSYLDPKGTGAKVDRLFCCLPSKVDPMWACLTVLLGKF